MTKVSDTKWKGYRKNVITRRLTGREIAPERDGEHGRDDGEIRERNSRRVVRVKREVITQIGR